MLPFSQTWSKFLVELCGAMHNIYKVGAPFLQRRRSSTAFCNVCCYSTKRDFGEVKNVKRKKCSHSEPKSRQGTPGNFEETPALLTALNAVEILDSNFPDEENCNHFQERGESLWESNSVTEQPSLIGCTHSEAKNVQNLKSQHMFYSKDHTQLQQTENRSKKTLENPPVPSEEAAAPEDDRSYIINIFLNDEKQDKGQNDSVDVHVKDLNIKPNDVCVKKLTENIRKGYPDINKILQDIPDRNDERKRLVGQLERYWGDVFKDSVMQIPQAGRNAQKKQLGVIQDRMIIQHDDPVVRAAQIDEAIKSNSLYKKQKRKSRNIAPDFGDGTSIGVVREDFETKPIIVDAPAEETNADNLVLSELDLVSLDVEASEEPIIKDPAPIKRYEKYNRGDTPKANQQEIAPRIQATKTQDHFDPIYEKYPTLVEKELIKDQLKKYKPTTSKLEIYPRKDTDEPQSKGNPEDCKLAVEDERLIVPMRDYPRSETLRPVPLAMGKRLKHYNKKTQDKIEEVVKLAAEVQQHHPKNSIERMVSFCKGLLRDERLAGRLPKFLREDFVDGQVRPKKLLKSENRYRPFIQQSYNAKKVEDSEVDTAKGRKAAPMVRSEEVFGSQHEFQQRCGVRERILPSTDSSFYRGGHRKFSCYTNTIESRIILRNSSKNRFDTALLLYIFQRSYACKDKDSKDPCSKVDEKAKLKPCSGGECKKADAKSRTAAKEDVEEKCEPFKCETDPEIDKIVAGEIGCTAKCLANRTPDEKAKPEPFPPPSDDDKCDPRYEREVEPALPKFDIMQDLGKYIKDENKEVQSYYGDNGYKNLEYYKFNRHSFYDIQRHLAKSRNPTPDPFAEKKAKALMRLKAMQEKQKKEKETASKCE